MHSADALYRFRPELYTVMTADKGTTVSKIICFSDDCSIGENTLKVSDAFRDIISFGFISNMLIEYAFQAVEAYDLHHTQFVREDMDDYFAHFRTQVDEAISITEEQELLSRLEREADNSLGFRESELEHDVRFYMATQPAAYAQARAASFSPETGLHWLTFFSYRMDEQRKLVLDEFSYNTFIDHSQQHDATILSNTYGILDGTDVISYTIEEDLSMSPLVYGNQITFTSPRETPRKFGAIREEDLNIS